MTMAIQRAAELLGLGGDPINTTANVLVSLAALGCLVFAVIYTARSAWQTTPLGRHMFFFAWAVLFAYGVGVARAWWPDADWLDYVRLVSLSTVVFVFWQRVYLLVRSLRASEEEDDGGS